MHSAVRLHGLQCRLLARSEVKNLHTLPHARLHVQAAKGYGSVRDALSVNASFLLAQMGQMAAGAPTGKDSLDLNATPFAEALSSEVGGVPVGFHSFY